jgi:uncharacterized lipoprotein NlpE involved in copper resistance
MKHFIQYFVSLCLLLIGLSACSQHESSLFTGDYRYYAGISEFFDCKTGVKYYLGKNGINKELEKEYLALKIEEKDDAYLKVEGYLMEESAEEHLIPATVFVPTNFLSFDTSRGCEHGRREGY